MMILYLMRHGEAVPEIVDVNRPLSPRGRQEVAKVGKFMKRSVGQVHAVWHSEKLRAKQTAEIFSDEIGFQNPCAEKKGLAPNDNPEIVLNALKQEMETRKDFNLVIVGHIPFLGVLASLLLTGSDRYEMINFSEASLACLESRVLPLWRLQWLIDPAISAL